MSDDWTKLFGSIDVGVGGVQPSPPTKSPNTPLPQAPAQTPSPASIKPPASANGTTQVAPGVFQMAASFGTSMAKFAAGGFRTTGTELHQRRLAVCDDCQHRAGTSCLVCGCILPLKAKMPHETCPLGKWPS